MPRISTSGTGVPCLARIGELLVFRQIELITLQVGGGAQRRGLRHAPRVHNLDAVLFLEAFDHRSGSRRAADDGGAQRTQIVAFFIEQGEQAKPDRGDTGGKGDFLRLDQFGQIARLQVRT